MYDNGRKKEIFEESDLTHILNDRNVNTNNNEIPIVSYKINPYNANGYPAGRFSRSNKRRWKRSNNNNPNFRFHKSQVYHSNNHTHNYPQSSSNNRGGYQHAQSSAVQQNNRSVSNGFACNDNIQENALHARQILQGNIMQAPQPPGMTANHIALQHPSNTYSNKHQYMHNPPTRSNTNYVFPPAFPPSNSSTLPSVFPSNNSRW